MRTRELLLLFMLSTNMAGFAVTKIISTTVANTFSPQNTVIAPGDIVEFQIGLGHNVAEVSLATYGAATGPAGTTAKPGGFFFDFGSTSGTVSNLSPGIYYFVCQSHASMGMKGTITVTSLGVNDFQLTKNYSVFPNPITDIVSIKNNSNSGDSSYTLIDEGGRVVFEGKLEDVSTSINLGQLNSGIYFLRVGDDRKQIFKLIKR